MRYLYPLNQIPNFFAWWYLVKGREVIGMGGKTILKTIGYLNLLPMIGNIHRPMFEDATVSGYLYSLLLRIVWIAFALVVLIPVIIISSVAIALWFTLPVFVLSKLFIGIFG